MSFRSFRHFNQEGHLTGYTLGLGREVVLEIALDPVCNMNATP